MARTFFKPESLYDIKNFVKTQEPETDFYCLGAGSNILIRDGGIDGTVIKLGQGFNYINLQNDIMHVGAGASDRSVSIFAKDNGIGGFEFLYNIPGTIGGGVKMNCGCYGAEIKDVLKDITIFDLETKNIRTLVAKEINFKYRQTDIKDTELVIEARFNTKKMDKSKIWGKMQQNESKRKSNQPTTGRMAGSIFKNPKGVSAWQIINKIGGSDMMVGGAYISNKHNNFIMANENATANDVEDLINIIKTKAKENYNIDLDLEVQIVGKKLFYINTVKQVN